MALRTVLQFPDKRLRVVSQPIGTITDELRQLAQDMCDVMYDEPGIGLAAPQLGEPCDSWSSTPSGPSRAQRAMR